MVDKTTVIKAGSVGSSLLPAIAIIGVGYLGYKAISSLNFGGITEGITEGITGGITGGIAGGITERVETVNDEMNDNPIFKYIAPDIQRKEDMTTEQKTALSNYKKGNVTTKTVAAKGSLYNKIFGGKTSIDPVAMGIPGADIVNDITKLTKQIQSGKVPETINIKGKTLTKVSPPGVNIANDIAKLTKQIQSGKVPETININGKTLTKVSSTDTKTTVKASSGGYSVAAESGTTLNKDKYKKIKAIRR